MGTDLVVRVDTSHVNRLYTGIVGLLMVMAMAALAGGVVAAATTGVAGWGFTYMIIAIGALVQALLHTYHWGVRVGAGVVLAMNAGGLSLTVPPTGTLTLPWSAVGSLGVHRVFFRRWVVLRPAAGVTLETPGVALTGRPRLWKWATRRGLYLTLGDTDSDVATVTAAANYFSAHRVAVQP